VRSATFILRGKVQNVLAELRPIEIYRSKRFRNEVALSLGTKGHNLGSIARLVKGVLGWLRMLNNQVVEQISQVLLDAGATAHSINEEPSLKIRNITPYPALFRAEMQRLFGVRLGETHLDMKIDELASVINLNHVARS
jgi:hypothetical protein